MAVRPMLGGKVRYWVALALPPYISVLWEKPSPHHRHDRGKKEPNRLVMVRTTLYADLGAAAASTLRQTRRSLWDVEQPAIGATRRKWIRQTREP